MRMLRAVRFAAKLDFGIEKHSALPIRPLAAMLRDIPSARLFEEVLKLFLSGHAASTFEMLVDLELFEPLFPASSKALEYNPTYTHTLISNALINTLICASSRTSRSLRPSCLLPCCGPPCLPRCCVPRSAVCRRSPRCRKRHTN